MIKLVDKTHILYFNLQAGARSFVTGAGARNRKDVWDDKGNNALITQQLFIYLYLDILSLSLESILSKKVIKIMKKIQLLN